MCVCACVWRVVMDTGTRSSLADGGEAPGTGNISRQTQGQKNDLRSHGVFCLFGWFPFTVRRSCEAGAVLGPEGEGGVCECSVLVRLVCGVSANGARRL